MSSGDGADGVPPSDSDSEKAPPRVMNLSSDEVNYLVFRYLQESGFVHSAFTFAHESMLGATGLRSANKTMPPGALITFLQKGLQYVAMEEKLRLEAAGSAKASLPAFSLLSTSTVSALARKDPPIQLNVPPAAAAAALKAKLEAEAKLQVERNSSVLPSQMSVNGPLSPPSLGQVDPENVNFARQALAAQAAAAQAAAALTQLPNNIQEQFQQQRAAVELAAFQQQQQNLQQQQLVSQQQNLRGDTAASNATATAQGGKRASSSSKRSAKKQKKDKETVTEESKEGPAQTMSEVQPMEVDEPVSSGDKTPDDKPTNGSHSNGNTPKSPRSAASSDGIMNGVQRSPNKKPDNRSIASNSEAPDDSATAVDEKEILRLDMHQSEVFMCAWNPVNTDLIATGSGDASARIWQMRGLHAAEGITTVKLLPHGTDSSDRKNKDVTTLEWSMDGKFLATGSYDGVARVWAQNGALMHTLEGHNGPIFSLKWNKKGNFLLSGSYDKTTIVWNVSGEKGVIEQQFQDHEAPALDVDWKDDETFASCSTDRTVHICKVGTEHPVRIFSGHEDEVNAVKWSPCRKYLASCSDDRTAKIWDVESDKTTPLFDLTDHKQEIYTVKWSPTGPGSPNPDKPAYLATASFDGTVRLWSMVDGSCYRTFDRHRDSVYSVAFSPSGDYLASGSLAGQMYIWNIEKGEHVKSYKGQGDIFEVAWNKEETRVAACFSSNIVAVIDYDASAPAENAPPAP